MRYNPIDPSTSMGALHLTVSDLGRSLRYYQAGIGLDCHRTESETAYLGAGGKDLLVLTEKTGARVAQRASGLYHFALLLPSRLELGKTINHLIGTGVPISGSADHAVSEAIYLSDPDGHGIELYRDRPREEWEYEAGGLRMTTELLDAAGLLAEPGANAEIWTGLHPATVLGHIHLQVANVKASQEFYVNLLGFDLVARYGPSASFVSAGGYHHHIGMNSWAGEGVAPPPEDSLALQWFSLRLPNPAAVAQIIDKVRAAELSVTEAEEGPIFCDPSSIQILLTT